MNTFIQALHGWYFLFLHESALPSLLEKKDLLLLILPSNDWNSPFFSSARFTLFHHAATVGLQQQTDSSAAGDTSATAHKLLRAAVSGQKSPVLLPQSENKGSSSAPTTEDEIYDFLFIEMAHLISSSLDWKFNPAGSWIQFKNKVLSNWPIGLSNHILCPVTTAMFQFGQPNYVPRYPKPIPMRKL